ncbi:hypothetical protein WICPIJ_009718 [Wickerhamomyces pijperi]|uniref:Uncharacterized protein n=1 Tax=Wickerhamomyces pijperi TaxID=599730 RepID=A0A9P8PKA9_WICPI|nr:hypothetical protein WICPIJ_009718 [Wickerhamomyces pijperi]
MELKAAFFNASSSACEDKAWMTLLKYTCNSLERTCFTNGLISMSLALVLPGSTAVWIEPAAVLPPLASPAVPVPVPVLPLALLSAPLTPLLPPLILKALEMSLVVSVFLLEWRMNLCACSRISWIRYSTSIAKLREVSSFKSDKPSESATSFTVSIGDHNVCESGCLDVCGLDIWCVEDKLNWLLIKERDLIKCLLVSFVYYFNQANCYVAVAHAHENPRNFGSAVEE